MHFAFQRALLTGVLSKSAPSNDFWGPYAPLHKAFVTPKSLEMARSAARPVHYLFSASRACRKISAKTEDRATVRATGDDFGTSLFNTTSAPEPNIVSGGTLRRPLGEDRLEVKSATPEAQSPRPQTDAFDNSHNKMAAETERFSDSTPSAIGIATGSST